MGLDQYFIAEKDGTKEEIGYLRKHNWIHGWMEQRWVERGKPLPKEWGKKRREEHADGEFNCVPLRLYIKDVNQLMRDIRTNKLEPVEGFFFGGGEPDDYTKKEELEILKTVKEHIRDGAKTFYDSWW